MKHRFHPPLLPGVSAMILLFQPAAADVHPFEAESTDKLTVISPDKTVSLTVSLERIDREKVRRVADEEQKDMVRELWLGDRQLPVDLLWRKPTMISSFDLKIDGQRVAIPERFWNDLPGLSLYKVIINRPVENEEQEWELADFTRDLRTPRVVRSADGGTVLISWVRPEE